MAEEKEIIDSETWKSSEGIGFKEICLKQIARITVLASKELTVGWWKKTWINPNRNAVDTQYYSDGRLAYCQAVEVLYDILSPKFEKKNNENMEKLNKQIKEINPLLIPDKKEKQLKIYELRNLWREVFRELCIFLESIGWLEIQGTEESQE